MLFSFSKQSLNILRSKAWMRRILPCHRVAVLNSYACLCSLWKRDAGLLRSVILAVCCFQDASGLSVRSSRAGAVRTESRTQ